jgi:hypothetical protein
MRLRRSAVLLVAAGAVGAVGLAQPAAAASPSDDDALKVMVSNLASMLPGQQGWVSAMWKANQDVCDVRVTVSGAGPKVSYPTNTDDHSSFFVNSALAEGNMDYTAFNFAVPGSVTAPVSLTLHVDYRELPPGQIKKTDDLKYKKVNCSGPKGEQDVTVTLPVAPSTGPAVVMKRSPVLMKRDTPTWTKIIFTGSKPGLDNFRVTITPTKGLKVIYPGDSTSAGLDGNTTLPVGKDDFVMVRLDASELDQSDGYGVSVPVKATYDGGTFSGSFVLNAVSA